MSDLRPGDVFAGYVIERFLGPGQSGDVYLVRHPRLPRREVLEVLPATLTASPGFREQFERDVAALSRSGQKVQDFGEHEGRLWVALEHAEPPIPPHPASVPPPSLPLVAPATSAPVPQHPAPGFGPASGPVPPAAPGVSVDGAQRVRSSRLTALLWVDLVFVVALWFWFGFWFHGSPLFAFEPGFWRWALTGATWVSVPLVAIVLVVIAIVAKRSRAMAVVGGLAVLACGAFLAYEWWYWSGRVFFGLIGIVLVIAGVVTVVFAARSSSWGQSAGVGGPVGSVAGALGPAGATASPGGFQGLVLTTKYFPLAWMFTFFKPVIEVDGQAMRGVWGANSIPLPPGEHRLHVHVPYLMPSRVGAVDVTVAVAPQCATQLEYAAPAWTFSGGSVGPSPQPYAGLGLSVAVMVVPFVILAVLMLLLPTLLV